MGFKINQLLTNDVALIWTCVILFKSLSHNIQLLWLRRKWRSKKLCKTSKN